MDSLVSYGWDPPGQQVPGVGFRWYHVPKVGTLRVVILCDGPMAYWGHFSGKRIRPCWGKACDFCGQGDGRMRRFLFSVVDSTAGGVGLIELPEAAALSVRTLEGRNGGLRGMHLELRRQTESNRSRILVEYLDSAPTIDWECLIAVDIQAAIVRSWSRRGEDVPEQLRMRVLSE